MLKTIIHSSSERVHRGTASTWASTGGVGELMYTPEIAPVADSLLWSALLAILPLLTIFLTLGALTSTAHRHGLTAVAVARIVALAAAGLPLGRAGLAVTRGFAFALFPIMWIVIPAIWLYELTVRAGHFEDLRLVINVISDDPGSQAIIIAFCFGG